MDNFVSPIILFDGVCNLCASFIQFIIKRDPEGKFRFASMQSETGKALLIKCGLSTTEFNSFVYISHDGHFLKSTAGLKLLKELGGIYQFLYWFIIIPKPLRDFIYTIVAKNRYQLFGKKDSCAIPSSDFEGRFLI